METTITQNENVVAAQSYAETDYQEALESIPVDAQTTTLLLFEARQKLAAADMASHLGQRSAADALRHDAELLRVLHFRLVAARAARAELDSH